ncbi:rplA family protein [Pseudomonas amygdali pv. lachrymans]|nr:rplA family protein [Pseudomonas amygdali pv. lachrymans]
MIVPTLRTLCVLSQVSDAAQICDAERHELRANAEHWHDS